MPTISTWNMQGANVEKWQHMVKSIMSTGADGLALQECGMQPASAQPLAPVIPISNPPGGGMPAPVTPVRWKVGSGDSYLYILTYNFGATPGSRCNLAIVTAQLPLYWWLVWAPYGAVWRPAVGATLPNGAAVFSMHAISPGGPDAQAVVTAIDSLAGSLPPAQRPVAWYVGGDFNREPTAWPGGFSVSPPDQPTYSTKSPQSRYDYVVSSNSANQGTVGPPPQGMIGQRLDETAPWSDHFAVYFANLH